MVPLPDQGQRCLSTLPVEFIRRNNSGYQAFTGRQGKLFRGSALLSEYRPAVNPLNGNQVRYAPDGAVIAKQIRIPLALRSIDQSSLSNAHILKGQTPFIRPGDMIG